MHLVVTARITPFNPGASPPPVNIPTLRTSAMFSPLLSSKIQSSKPSLGFYPIRAQPKTPPAGPGKIQDGAEPRLQEAASRRPRPGPIDTGNPVPVPAAGS